MNCQCINFPVKIGDDIIEELGGSHESPMFFKLTTLIGVHIYGNAAVRSHMNRATRSLVENDTFSSRRLTA